MCVSPGHEEQEPCAKHADLHPFLLHPIICARSERVSRLGKEIVGLMSDLPLNASSSVFVRVDEDKVSGVACTLVLLSLPCALGECFPTPPITCVCCA